MKKNKNNKKLKYTVAATLIAAAVFIIAFSRGLFGEELQRVFNPTEFFDTSVDFVKVTDVGQADSILIYSNGYSAVIFEGESADPKRVAEEIKAEVNRLKADGIDKKLFSAVRCGMYGEAVRSFNSVKSIASQLVECAMSDSGLFDELKYIKSATPEKVYKRLSLLDNDKTVLSVINTR